jgi:hypothetical protein
MGNRRPQQKSRQCRKKVRELRAASKFDIRSHRKIPPQEHRRNSPVAKIATAIGRVQDHHKRLLRLGLSKIAHDPSSTSTAAKRFYNRRRLSGIYPVTRATFLFTARRDVTAGGHCRRHFVSRPKEIMEAVAERGA